MPIVMERDGIDAVACGRIHQEAGVGGDVGGKENAAVGNILNDFVDGKGVDIKSDRLVKLVQGCEYRLRWEILVGELDRLPEREIKIPRPEFCDVELFFRRYDELFERSAGLLLQVVH